MAEKLYTVAEANALLPKLKPLLERVRETQKKLAEDKTVAMVREKAAQNGGGVPGKELAELTRTLEADLKQLQEWSIVLRDPAIGLIDFLHQRGNQVVFLCWKLGEGNQIEWWHPIDTGIAGRQRL